MPLIVARDIGPGSIISADFTFKDWNTVQPKPQSFEPIEMKCAQCGAPWVETHGGWRLHVGGEWRGSPRTS